MEQYYQKALKIGFVDNQVLCQLTVKPKVNVSCRLNLRRFVSCQLKFWPFASCQLTPSTPSVKSLRLNLQRRVLNNDENALFVVHSLNKLQYRMPIIEQQILKDVGLGIVNKCQIKIWHCIRLLTRLASRVSFCLLVWEGKKEALPESR